MKRCGAYDAYLDVLKRAEREREFAEREKVYQRITEKVLGIVEKRLEKFDPEELSQSNVMEWLKNSIDIELALFGKGESTNEDSGKNFSGQLEINFVNDFDGL